jgi:type VI secretion system protein ImpH
MASTNGQTPDPLMERVAKQPFAFDFFRAVRLLQALHADSPRVGYSPSPAQEPVRFAQKPSLAFASSTLDGLGPGPLPSIPRLWVNFFGLSGPNGPLPLHLTEYARDRELHHNDHTFTAFLNLFNHRLTSLFFRAWADNQKALDLDRPEDQRFAAYLGSFFGMGMESLWNRDAVPDRAKLYFSGHLASQNRNAEGLESILEDYFGIPTQIKTFVGRWLEVPEDSCCRLGMSPQTGRLGLSTLVGSRFWECQLNFRIAMGPMKLSDFERLLPSGSAFKRLQCWVRNYCGEQFFWDVNLVLKKAEVPPVALGRSGRLGWTTWLKTRPFERDADDLVLIPPGN